MAGWGFAMLWLLAGSVADAAPLGALVAHSRNLVCRARLQSAGGIWSRLGLPKRRGGPVMRDVPARLQRDRAKTPDADDDEAIQNDASALGVSEDCRPSSLLEPLGVLISSYPSLRSHQSFSRRSPRGPPAFS